MRRAAKDNGADDLVDRKTQSRRISRIFHDVDDAGRGAQRDQASKNRRRGGTDHWDRFQYAGQERQQHGVLDAKDNAKTDIGGNRGIDHDANHADEIVHQHRIKPRPNPRRQRTPMRWHDPEQAARDLSSAHKK